MVWDGVVSLSRYKVLDIFEFHELLFELFSLFVLECNFLNQIGLLLRFHDNLIVRGVLMGIFQIILDDILDFLFLFIDRTVLQFLVPWNSKFLGLELQIGLMLELQDHFSLSFLGG